MNKREMRASNMSVQTSRRRGTFLKPKKLGVDKMVSLQSGRVSNEKK